jgi:hypothetical protein
LANANEENYMSACKCKDPERLGGHFICHYLMYHKDDSKKEFLEDFSTNISRLGLEEVLNIYSRIDKEIEKFEKMQKCSLAEEFRGMHEYFKEHVLDKIQLPESTLNLINSH